MLTYTITFGSRTEADAAAERINDVHTRVKGVDPVTGLPYDGLDPDLLLYVHACLVDSALLFEAATVGRLDDAGRQRFHEEQMLAAEMVRIPRSAIPPTVPALRAYLQAVYDSGILRVEEAAERVAALFRDPPRRRRPVLAGVSRLAFGTLSPGLVDLRVELTRLAGRRCTRPSPRRDGSGRCSPTASGSSRRTRSGCSGAPGSPCRSASRVRADPSASGRRGRSGSGRLP